MSSTFALPIATKNLKIRTLESSSSKLMKSRDMTASRTSTEWISLEIKLALWLRNGNLSLKVLSKLKLLTDTSLECSALPSQRRHTNRSKPPATPKHPTRSLSERRWWKLCNPTYKSQVSGSLSRLCKYFIYCVFNG